MQYQQQQQQQLQQQFTFVESSFVETVHKEKLKQLQTKFTYLREPKKRTRTTPDQFNVLLCAFEKESCPTPKQRKALADKTGMTPRTVQVWFQNRRAKYRANATAIHSARSTSPESESEFESEESPSSSSRSSSSSSSSSPPSSSPSSSSCDNSSDSEDQETEEQDLESAAEAEFAELTDCDFKLQPNTFDNHNCSEGNQNIFSDFLGYRCNDDPFLFTQVEFDITTF